jgi:hypothetical protein
VVEGGTTQQQPEDAAALAARKARLFYIFTYISTTTATSTSTTFSSKLAHMCILEIKNIYFFQYPVIMPKMISSYIFQFLAVII